MSEKDELLASWERECQTTRRVLRKAPSIYGPSAGEPRPPTADGRVPASPEAP